MDIKQGLNRLQQKFNEDPITVILVGSFALAAVAKVIDAGSAAQGRRAYAKQIDYKINHQR
jgi:hypothetical protein